MGFLENLVYIIDYLLDVTSSCCLTASTMSDSPVSDPERAGFSSSEKKSPYEDATRVYTDEALGETEVTGFEETRELK